MSHEHPIKSPKKLIEVALPLDAINKASAREKSIRHGHPSTLHLWWARRPLAAARAVIFSQLVNDPEDLWRVQNPGQEPNKQVRGHWTKARARLFKIIEDLVLWENTTNEEVLQPARDEIRKSWREVCELNQDHPQAAELFDPKNMPGLHDPFAGGGTIPLEAQRLGLDAYASDLNPVAVLINKAMIEIPPKFAGMPPVNPESRAKKELVQREWKGAEGLAEDVRYYGKWMRDEAEKRIGHLYPKVKITGEMVEERPDLEPYRGKDVNVIAWLWARTVKSPNPAFSDVDVPLVGSFVVSSKRGNEAYIKPILEGQHYQFRVVKGEPPPDLPVGTKAGGRGANFLCLLSGVPIAAEYIRSKAQAGEMGTRLLAVVVEGGRKRFYVSPNKDIEKSAKCQTPNWKPDVSFFQKALGFRVGNYGMSKWSDLFTDRQILMLSTYAELISSVRSQLAAESKIVAENINSDVEESLVGTEYCDAVATYLAIGVSKLADYNSSLVAWSKSRDQAVHVFGRHALPMVWDFAEVAPFANAAGDLAVSLGGISRVISSFNATIGGIAEQHSAQNQELSRNNCVSTDPPYYDNIGYSDLSDYFYVWLRHGLREIYPQLLATRSTPKEEELVATPARHGGRENAERFFLSGMTDAMGRICELAHPAYPVTIYYAFKQAETSSTNTSSTGWETFLEAVIVSGFALVGTWPIRTEKPGRLRESGFNALASSIVLVCRARGVTDNTISRREFIRELNATLPAALDAMTRESEDLPSPVAPVDLSQAIIGPGMGIFSKYSAVLEADGSPMTIRTALQLINRFLAEDDFDADTQFCLHWFETHGWEPGVFGEADVLARAKATSVGGLEDAGVIRSGSGKVKLLKWSEYPADWDPNKDLRLPIWETLHQLIRAFRQGGESAAGQLLAQGNVQSRAEAARQLAYRLYTLCERKGWAEDARAYNELITSWSGIETAAPQIKQGELF